MLHRNRITDPQLLPVQVNIKMTFQFREHLHKIASEQGVSLSHLIRNMLEASFPIYRDWVDSEDDQ